MSNYLASLVEHYELMGEHFKDTEGYKGYEQNPANLRRLGEAGFLKGFMRANAYGTPDQLFETLDKRRGDLGAFEQATSFRFGSIPYEEAERSIRRFAKEVLPVLNEDLALEASYPESRYRESASREAQGKPHSEAGPGCSLGAGCLRAHNPQNASDV